jgi:hypothetical protein
MGLVLKIGNAYVGNACRSLYISELTGVYDDPDNLGGWDTPNPATSDADETHLIVTFPNGTTIVDITDPTGMPTDDDKFEYEITAAVLGGAHVSDGLYSIEYTVTIGDDTYTTGKKYFLFTCNIECCVSKMFARIATMSDCSCDSVVIKNALYASALKNGLLALKDCGNITGINSLITKLNTICNLSESNCGCS